MAPAKRASSRFIARYLVQTPSGTNASESAKSTARATAAPTNARRRRRQTSTAAITTGEVLNATAPTHAATAPARRAGRPTSMPSATETNSSGETCPMETVLSASGVSSTAAITRDAAASRLRPAILRQSSPMAAMSPSAESTLNTPVPSVFPPRLAAQMRGSASGLARYASPWQRAGAGVATVRHQVLRYSGVTSSHDSIGSTYRWRGASAT